MAEEFHRHQLGVVVDIVPNHMARPTPEWRNKQLWSVLYQGRASPYAHWFDVDWDAQDGQAADAHPERPGGEVPGRPDHRHDAEDRRSTTGIPARCCGTSTTCCRCGTAWPTCRWACCWPQQHYRLADWHEATTQLNWRRFFDVDTLIAVRAEDPDVFDATHRVVLRLCPRG